jgi:hypothetical protein
MNFPIYFLTFGGMKHGPLSREDVGSLYEADIVGLDLPVTGGMENLTVRDIVSPPEGSGTYEDINRSSNYPNVTRTTGGEQTAERKLSLRVVRAAGRGGATW